MTTMTTLRRPLSTIALALTCGGALVGCVVAPVEPYPYYGGPVMTAPPPPRAEVYGVAPVPGYIWLGGYWNWSGNRHQWVGGHWEPPRPGYRWAPPEWRRDGPGWRQAPGRWERR